MKNSNTLRNALIRLALALGLLLLSLAFLHHYKMQGANQKELYDISVVPPTCVDNGYSLYTNRSNGATYVDDILEATGHRYSDWTEDLQTGTYETWYRYRTCSACDEKEAQLCYPDFDLPLLALEGDLGQIGKKTEVNMTARFDSDDVSFDTWATLKYQGHESLYFDKKNYTLKFYKDEDRSEKYKMTFSHWNPENKYIIKANYIDPSQCRNLICADVWADVTASREGVQKKLTELSNYGAVDGFPIVLYINGELQGLYTMNLHKDDDLFGMSDGEEEAILITNHSDSEEAYFRAAAEFTDDSPWEVEFCGTEDNRWAKDKLNALITFVRESDDETFAEELNSYLDVNSAIDYLLSIYVLGLTDNASSNLILVSYGENEPWIASVYDMENGFGLYADGSDAFGADYFLPEKTSDGWDSATGSLLWDRMLEHFFPRIQVRYSRLRQDVFDPERLCGRVLDFTASIPDALYQADHACFTHPSDLDHVKQITEYISARIALLDFVFLNEGLVE